MALINDSIIREKGERLAPRSFQIMDTRFSPWRVSFPQQAHCSLKKGHPFQDLSDGPHHEGPSPDASHLRANTGAPHETRIRPRGLGQWRKTPSPCRTWDSHAQPPLLKMLFQREGGTEWGLRITSRVTLLGPISNITIWPWEDSLLLPLPPNL